MSMLFKNFNKFRSIGSKFSTFGKGVDLFEPITVAEKQKTLIESYGDKAFLINRCLYRQSVLVFPKTTLLWNAKTFEDITIESLNIFTLIYPTVEILFIGCGRTVPNMLNKSIYDHFRSKGIVIEITNTANAASTFNVLNSEDRNVAAALLTMDPVKDKELFINT